jgi:hypothetical protein
MYVVLIASRSVLCFGLLLAPNSMYSHVGEMSLSLFLVLTFSCPCLGLLSAPNSMYSTVGERCLCYRFIVPTFGCPCLILLSGPNCNAQYCWLEVSLVRGLLVKVVKM